MRILLLALLLSITFSLSAQPPCAGQAGRSAQTATVVCGTLTFSEGLLPDCTGPDLPPAGCPEAVTSSHSAWYRFHCYQSGTLAFVITPGNINDDYDWQLMDFTGFAPGDVYTTNLMLSLSLSGLTGPTGCNATGTSNLSCGGNSYPTFNRMPDLVAGHDYLLMVTNYSNSGTGYALDFTGGTAVLTDNQLPNLLSAAIEGCNASLLKLIFSEDILCSSLTPLGNEFYIDGVPAAITSITSTCGLGLNAFTTLTLQLAVPLSAGGHLITVNDGTDLNTLLDVCLTAMPVGTSVNFTVPVIAPAQVSTISFTCKHRCIMK